MARARLARQVVRPRSAATAAGDTGPARAEKAEQKVRFRIYDSLDFFKECKKVVLKHYRSGVASRSVRPRPVRRPGVIFCPAAARLSSRLQSEPLSGLPDISPGPLPAVSITLVGCAARATARALHKAFSVLAAELQAPCRQQLRPSAAAVAIICSTAGRRARLPRTPLHTEPLFGFFPIQSPCLPPFASVAPRRPAPRRPPTALKCVASHGRDCKSSCLLATRSCCSARVAPFIDFLFTLSIQFLPAELLPRLVSRNIPSFCSRFLKTNSGSS